MARLVKATRTYWRDAAIAGALGGAVMLLYVGLIEGWMGLGIWTPLDLLAIGLPGMPVAVPGYDAVATAVGVAFHLMAAAGWGLAYGAFLALLSTYGTPGMARSWTVGALLGLGWGVAVYLLMGLLIAPLLNPDAFVLGPVTYFTAHLLFGLVTGLAFTWLSRRGRLAVTFAPAEAPVSTPTRR